MAKTDFEKWQETIDRALDDAKWDEYDCDIVRAVSEFNRHLINTKGYYPLDWQLVKAMVWTETGGPSNPAWKTRPMQIGNAGDPGLSALLSDKEGGDLIMPPDLQKSLTAAVAASNPRMNIKAGIAYLLMRFAVYGFETVNDADTTTYSVTVMPGDSLDKIARANGTTIEILKKLNPGVNVLKPKQVLQYQKASVQKVIQRWQPVTTSAVAIRYNVGDSRYAKKLDYCLKLMGKIRRVKCAA